MEAVVKTLALTTVGWSERLEWLWKTLCNEFFYGCHFLSLSASGIVLATMLFLQIPIRWELCILAYLLTQTAYMYNHYREFTEDSQVESKRVQHLRLYGRFFPALVFVYGFTFVSILLVFGSLQGTLFGLLFLGLGLFYTEYGKMLTKKILGFKNFYMSFSLSLLILFSVIYCGYSITLGVILFSLFMFLNMSINTTFYDLKDMELDKQQKLRTLPLYLGKKRFLKVLHVLNVVSFVPLVLGVWLAVLPVFTLILFVMFVSGFYYIQKAFDPQANLDFLSYVVVDGQYYLLLILVFIGTFACGFS